MVEWARVERWGNRSVECMIGQVVATGAVAHNVHMCCAEDCEC